MLKRLCRIGFWLRGLAVLSLVCGCSRPGTLPETTIRWAGVEEFADLVQAGDGVLLDVRTPEEFQSGHIPGALNLNVLSSEFTSEIRQLDPDAGYLVYCRAGRRSARACELMGEAGFRKLTALAPGFNGWTAARKAVER